MLQKTIDTKCHQHLDSEEDGKGTKATLDVNLKTCGLCHTENLGYPIRQFAKRVFTSASFVDAMIPQMCPFSEPDLVQNSQQTTSQQSMQCCVTNTWTQRMERF